MGAVYCFLRDWKGMGVAFEGASWSLVQDWLPSLENWEVFLLEESLEFFEALAFLLGFFFVDLKPLEGWGLDDC